MTLELILGIAGAVAIFALLRFGMKKPWAVSIIAAVAVLLAVNIGWVKPALESVGDDSCPFKQGTDGYVLRLRAQPPQYFADLRQALRVHVPGHPGHLASI